MTGRSIVVADDHPETLDALREVLEDDGWTVVAAVGNAAAAVEAARRTRPDVCLLDVNMPGGGPAAAERIAEELPEVAVVMLTVSASADDLFSALRSGARGYLLKDIDPARLGPTVRSILAGETPMPRSLTARMIQEFKGRETTRRGKHPGERLTDVEWRVLELLRDGFGYVDVAVQLTRSESDVRTTVASILRKLRVSSQQEAITVLDDD